MKIFVFVLSVFSLVLDECLSRTKYMPGSIPSNETSFFTAAVVSAVRERRKILLRADILDVHELARSKRWRRELLSENVLTESSDNVHSKSQDRLLLIHLQDANNVTQRQSVEKALQCSLRRYIPHHTFVVRLSLPQVPESDQLLPNILSR